MRRTLILGALAAIFIVLYSGCMSSSVTLHDKLGTNAARGYAEFYLGVVVAKGGMSNPEFHVLVANATTEGSRPFGKVTALCRHGPARLRVACSPGINEFVITPTYRDGPDLDNYSEWIAAAPQRVSVHISQDMVTPVRIMIDISSETCGTKKLKNPVTWSGSGWSRTDFARQFFEYEYKVTTVAGAPQFYYELVATKYECKGGMVFVEGRSQTEVDNLKKRLLSSAAGLNLQESSDSMEFFKRFHGNSRNDTVPQGVMTRILLFAKGVKVLAFD